MKTLVIAMITALLGPAIAWSCSCNPVTPQQNFCNCDAVFSGTVEAISVADDIRYVDLLVTQVWRGSPPATVTVSTAALEQWCGVEGFDLGEEWLIYGYGSGAAYSTGYCDRTQQFPIHPEDAAFLQSPDCTVPVDPETWGRLKATYR